MFIHGSITKTLPDGSEVVADYMIDTVKQELIQVGGEHEIQADEIDLLMALMGGPDDDDDDEGEDE